MEKSSGWTLEQIALIVDGTLTGRSDFVVRRPGSIDGARPDAMGFAETVEFLHRLEATSIGAILVPADAPTSPKPLIRVDNPRQAFAKFLNLCERPLPLQPGIHPTAIVSPDAEISATAAIGPYAVVEAGSTVGAGARIYPFVYIGERCSVGENSVLYPHCTLYRDVTLGARAVIHAGAVLGADGFGFTWNGERQVKVPQLGVTILGDDVEIGACTTVDRAMLESTILEDGVKLDNQVQIGHNSSIGAHTVIAGQTGISGSVKVGARCVLAGQVGTVDHVKIGDDVTLTGRSAVSKDIESPGVYRGAPAIPYVEELRFEASLRKVSGLLDKVRDLERRISELEASK